MTVLTSGIGGLVTGRRWALSSVLGGMIAVIHLGLVAIGKPGTSPNVAMYALSVGRLAVVGLLLFVALHYGVDALPMTAGLAAVYMGLLGGLLADHARHH